jgi:hypothetical protein
MQRHLAIALACVVVTAPATAAFAEDVESILARVNQKQEESMAGVDCYAVDQSLVGNRATLIFRRTLAAGPDGQPVTTFQQAPGCAESATTGAATTGNQAMMDEYARGLEMTGDALSTEMEKGFEQAGLPPGLLGAMGGDPWVSADPRTMMGGMAGFARAAGKADAEGRQDGAASAQETAAAMAEFSSKAKLMGKETVDGRPAFHLRADGLDRVQQADGQTFEIDAVSVWIDTSAYVPLRTVIEGVATSAGESRPITIEKIDSDYRTVAGSRMYQPYRQLLRMQGMLTAEQEQQMREASQQLADTEQQLAQMPPQQRQMVMNQMGPQLATMRRMAAGGGVEIETTVNEIVVNPDEAALQRLSARTSSPSMPGMAGLPAGMPATLSAAPQAAAPATAPATAPTGGTAEAREQARQACLAEKVRQAQAAQKKKRGFGSLMNAAGRVASRLGGAEVTQAIGDISTASATAEDLASAARDLGLTEDDIAACDQP